MVDYYLVAIGFILLFIVGCLLGVMCNIIILQNKPIYHRFAFCVVVGLLYGCIGGGIAYDKSLTTDSPDYQYGYQHGYSEQNKTRYQAAQSLTTDENTLVSYYAQGYVKGYEAGEQNITYQKNKQTLGM